MSERQELLYELFIISVLLTVIFVSSVVAADFLVGMHDPQWLTQLPL